MRKYILLLAILFASCETPMEETKGFGFWLGKAKSKDNEDC